MGLTLKNIAEAINTWNGFLPEIVDWDEVFNQLNKTLSDWYKSNHGNEKKLYIDRDLGRINLLYNGRKERDTESKESKELYRIRVILDEVACSVKITTEVLDYDRDAIRKEDVIRTLNRLNRELVAGRFFQEDYSIYYSEGFDIREDGSFDKDGFINAVKRSRGAIYTFEHGGIYNVENERFISSLQTTVPRIDNCDECSIWEDGNIVIDNMHLLRYILPSIGMNSNLKTYGCIFCDMDGYIMVSPSWYAREYEYLLQKRIEYGSGYEDIDYLKRSLDVFRETYAEIELRKEEQISKYHYMLGFMVEAKPLVRKILGEKPIIMRFDNGNVFLAPKEMGYILQMFGKGKMETWEINHKRLSYGDVPLTEDERSLEWIRVDESEECEYDG